MKSTFRVLFFLKRDKVKKNGNMPIMARITIDGKLVQFNTKLEVNPKNWSVVHHSLFLEYVYNKSVNRSNDT